MSCLVKKQPPIIIVEIQKIKPHQLPCIQHKIQQDCRYPNSRIEEDISEFNKFLEECCATNRSSSFVEKEISEFKKFLDSL